MPLWNLSDRFYIDQVYSNTQVPTQVNTNQHTKTRVQHESTQADTSQHESTRVRHESTRINTSPTRVNTSQHRPKTGLDHEKEKNMVKRKDKTWLSECVEDSIFQDIGFFLKFMTNWTIRHYFFL